MHPIRRKKMKKKLIAVILTLAMLTVFAAFTVGCGEGINHTRRYEYLLRLFDESTTWEITRNDGPLDGQGTPPANVLRQFTAEKGGHFVIVRLLNNVTLAQEQQSVWTAEAEIQSVHREGLIVMGGSTPAVNVARAELNSLIATTVGTGTVDTVVLPPTLVTETARFASIITALQALQFTVVDTAATVPNLPATISQIRSVGRGPHGANIAVLNSEAAAVAWYNATPTATQVRYRSGWIVVSGLITTNAGFVIEIVQDVLAGGTGANIQEPYTPDTTGGLSGYFDIIHVVQIVAGNSTNIEPGAPGWTGFAHFTLNFTGNRLTTAGTQLLALNNRDFSVIDGELSVDVPAAMADRYEFEILENGDIVITRMIDNMGHIFTFSPRA